MCDVACMFALRFVRYIADTLGSKMSVGTTTFRRVYHIVTGDDFHHLHKNLLRDSKLQYL